MTQSLHDAAAGVALQRLVAFSERTSRFRAPGLTQGFRPVRRTKRAVDAVSTTQQESARIDMGRWFPALPGTSLQDTTKEGSEDSKSLPKGNGQLCQYKCSYCGKIKTSSSMGNDGKVRIRCGCGGQHQDRVSRMHAAWRRLDNDRDISGAKRPRFNRVFLDQHSDVLMNFPLVFVDETEAQRAKLAAESQP